MTHWHAILSILLLPVFGSASELAVQVTDFVKAAEQANAAVKCDSNALEAEIDAEKETGRLTIIEVYHSNADQMLVSPRICASATKKNFESGGIGGVFCRNSNTIFINNMDLKIGSGSILAHEYEHYRNAKKFNRDLGQHPLDIQKGLLEKARKTSTAGKWPKELFSLMAQAQFLYLWDEARGLLQEYKCSRTNWVIGAEGYVVAALDGYLKIGVGKIAVPPYSRKLIFGLAAAYQEPSQVVNDSLFRAFLDQIVAENAGLTE